MTTPPAAAGPRTPADLLDAALRADPARPLLTFYDDATGERAELSVATFATWVAKTANLLRDDLDARPGTTLALALPAHWQAAVLLQSAWALGLCVRPVPPGQAAPAAEVTVASYDALEAGLVVAPGTELVVLGLGPMALPRPGREAPAGALDYDREAPAHGDRFVPSWAPEPAAAALRTPEGDRSAEQLARLALAQRAVPAGGRLLVAEPLVTLPAVLAGLLVPLAAGVTAVLCRHLDPAGLADRVRQEEIVASVTPLGGPPALSAWSPGAA